MDHDDVGDRGVVEVLENQKFPNWCISPKVMKIDTRQVRWTDAHPLNRRDTQEAEYLRLFRTE